MSLNFQAKSFCTRFRLPEITSILVFAIASPLVTNSPVYAADIVDSFSTFISLEIKPQTQIAPEVMLIRQAIIGQESGANFQAVNRHSGALGYAQVMPENLPQWSKEALGFSVSRKDFLASPELQIAIVDFKLNQYWQKSIVASRGNVAIAIQRVAAWWYSGKPEKYTSTKTQYYAGHRYPSIAAYSQSILRRYQLILNAQNPSQPQRGV
ncbi:MULTISPECIES: lytic transglycosylase domain-containing protein [Leptolyngbya]|uniref:Lytic transglycosylase domain-containing protein n=1 Tax=Leptolyngbya boryana CZ1 TaxID=3060204 RepID=A0AA97ANK5_LEPBY|nr:MULTISPECIES: lytic transglycosylase domain-containing protein [Leptolyngbya]MBD1855326.1 lytic transglycosylase domain-containing protein [Leptolyngbya sp. FACHB-1624]MBN8561796.1 lytic transglycosylase domain-containing protein [Leptolyngbya sp. UWPOB_LEPTO1]MCY6491392.1 lytic transglycosylase domain-containing protein [Leptolyngbya sp. GGD]WNZ45833.1 lytic transglycosylase domain-containing protein [Leptolyngbya boryana CZ1]